MNTDDAITKLKDRIALVRTMIDRMRQQMVDLEGEAQRLSIALGVMEQLEATSDDGLLTGKRTGNHVYWTKSYRKLDLGDMKVVLDEDSSQAPDDESGMKVPFVFTSKPMPLSEAYMPPATKHLIKALFDAEKSLTRVEVIEAVRARKPDMNEGTVATTLSKLVSEGFLVREGNSYRRKDGIAGAGHTGDTEDLLNTDPSSEEATPNPSYGEHGKEDES